MPLHLDEGLETEAEGLQDLEKPQRALTDAEPVQISLDIPEKQNKSVILCVCLSTHDCMHVYVSVPVCLPVFVSICMHICICAWLCLPVYVCVCMSVSICLCLCLSVYDYVYLSTCMLLYVCLSAFVSV